MTALELSIRLPGGGDPLSDRNLDALHAAGCDYATFSTHGDGLLVACLDTDGDPEPAVCATFADIAIALPGAEIVNVTVLGNDAP